MSATPTKETRKRKVLTLADKVSVIERKRSGTSCRAIATSMNVGKTQIQSIVASADTIMAEWRNGGRGEQRYLKVRKTEYDELNRLVWDWFCAARSKNIPVSGRLIQEKALLYALEMGHDNFSASNGWLQSFQKRYNIRWAALNGEAAEVCQDTVDDWKQRLPALCEGYQPQDIFNADETGLYYRTLPDRSLVVKGATCSGGKQAKERVTVLLACSATGERLKPVVIGKAANPRCFKGYAKHNLPVTYYANKKAWVTGDLFKSWLQSVNAKMRIQRRKILMFIDNCGAHPDVSLSHVKLAFLPPNTTSRLQPLDAGIIKMVKSVYRKKLLRHILFNMDDANNGSELAKTVDVLDAIHWVAMSWQAVTESTIQKCFANCGFVTSAPTTVSADPEVEPDSDFTGLLREVTWEDFVNVDENLETTHTHTDDWEAKLLASAKQPATNSDPDSESDTEDSQDIESAQPSAPSAKEVAESLLKARDFALINQNPELLELMTKSIAVMENCKWDKVSKAKQTTMDSFLS